MNCLMEATTTPQISTAWPSDGLMSGKVTLADLSFMRLYRCHRILQTKSPPTIAMTMWSERAVIARCIKQDFP